MGKTQGNILIIGGSGFIGANLIKRLYNQKCKIVVFAKNTDHLFLNGLKIKRIKGDVRNYDSVLKAVKGCEYVYHLAACSLNTQKDKEKIFGVNVLGTENVMRACLACNVKKVVHVSSSAVFGFSKSKKTKLNEKDNLDFKDNLYAQSKKLGEDMVRFYVNKGLNATIVNPSYVIGAGEIDSARFVLYQSIANGRIKLVFPGGGGNVAVEDLVEGMLLALKSGKAGERYILSTNNVSLYHFYNLVARLLKRPKIKIKIPRILYYPMYGLGLILKQTMKNSALTPETVRWHFNFKYFDNYKAKKELGWKPKIRLEESIKRTIKYYKAIGLIK